MDLAGDLASYSPGAKVVVFEGGGDSEFDLRMTCTLFPELQGVVNPIPGGDKARVRELHELLQRATGDLAMRFFAIVDRDSDSVPASSVNVFEWDVYHIENYLLHPKYVCSVSIDRALPSRRVSGKRY